MIIRHDNLNIDVEVKINKYCIKIYDSYKIKKTSDMRWFIIKLMELEEYKTYGFYARYSCSYIAEWKVHNFLYNVLGIFKSHCKDVDLDRVLPTKPFRRKIEYLVYNFLSIFYR